MCKKRWSIGLGQEGVAWGENAWNTLKGGGTEKREGEINIFERGNKLGQETKGGYLKKGDWNPLRNYGLIKTSASYPWLSSFWGNTQCPQGYCKTQISTGFSVSIPWEHLNYIQQHSMYISYKLYIHYTYMYVCVYIYILSSSRVPNNRKGVDIVIITNNRGGWTGLIKYCRWFLSTYMLN